MKAFTTEQLQRLVALVKASQSVAVLTHTHPDGDALGSASAMASWLREGLGKDAAVLLPDNPGDGISFIVPDDCPLYIGPDPEALSFLSGASLIILADANGFARTEGLADAARASKAPKILIDHHVGPCSEEFDLVFSETEVSSASELLYWILTSVGARMPLDCASALMAGMTTDTNNFANSTYPSTLRMASQLLEAGVDRDLLIRRLYQSGRENRVRITGWLLTEGLKVDGPAAWMILPREVRREFDLRDGETEGVVNMPLSIGRVKLSAFIKEEEGGIFRVSLRSKPGVSARECSQRFFHGGGHEQAAGGKIIIGEDVASREEVPGYVEQALKTFLG